MAVDPLGLYNQKRDFKKTSEPKGKRSRTKGQSFVVQKHDATRLHWDFRLEIDGVLKSWAVTRGPSLNPSDKRLAVRTEDHPLDYGTFEGVIPKGEYGGGTVMLWDRGTWAPVTGKSVHDLEKGHLHFTLDGERMRGEWLLVRIKGKPGEKHELASPQNRRCLCGKQRRSGRTCSDQRGLWPDDAGHCSRKESLQNTQGCQSQIKGNARI
jgi:bifunctional non-homologous end joining protein LigD